MQMLNDSGVQLIFNTIQDDDVDISAHTRHAAALAREIGEVVQTTPLDELGRTYREITLAPLLGDLIREGVGVGISKDAKHLNVIGTKKPPKAISDKVSEAQQGLVELLKDTASSTSPRSTDEAAKAIVVAARYVHDKSKHALLSTSESEVLVTALAMVFEQSLRAQMRANHPGDVQGNA